jgi:hypothetical protein
MTDTTREALAAECKRLAHGVFLRGGDSAHLRLLVAAIDQLRDATPEQVPAVQARPYCAKLAGPCPDNCPAVEVSGCGLTRMHGDCWRVKPPPFTLPPTDAERRAALATGALPYPARSDIRLALTALLSLVRREAPHLSGKVLGDAEAALAAPRGQAEDAQRLDALEAADAQEQWIVAKGEAGFTVWLGTGTARTERTIRAAIDASVAARASDARKGEAS